MKFLIALIFVSRTFAQVQGAVYDILPRTSSVTGEVRFRELLTNGGNHVGFRAPDSVTVNTIWTLPDGSAAGCLTNDGMDILSWSASCGVLPVVDTTSIAEGSADPSKEVRFEVDGLTTATTRVLTVPDENINLIGDSNHRYAAPFIFSLYRANGTLASPSNLTGSETILEINPYGRSGGSYVQAGGIRFAATASGPLYTDYRVYTTAADILRAVQIIDSTGNTYPGQDSQQDLGLTSARWKQINGNRINMYSAAGVGVQLNSFVSDARVDIDLSTYSATDNSGISFTRARGTLASPSNAVSGDRIGSFFWNTRASAGNVTSGYVSMYADTVSGANVTTSTRFGVSAGAGGVFDALILNGAVSGSGVTGYGTLSGDWLPDTNNTKSLGLSAQRWKKLWVTDIDISGACTGCDSTLPSNVVNIDDYGADNTCTTDNSSELAAAEAALDALGGGTILWGPGNPAYCFDDTYTTSYHRIGWRGYGGSTERNLTPISTTILAWRIAPASTRPLIDFYQAEGRRVEDIMLSGQGFANTSLLRLTDSARGRYIHLRGDHWTDGPGLELTGDGGAPSGNYSCYNYFLEPFFEAHTYFNDLVTPTNGSGLLLDGHSLSATGAACSNIFAGGLFMFGALGSTNYGIKLKYADNNIFQDVRVSEGSAFTSSRPAILLTQDSGAFPQENTGRIILHDVTGASVQGVGGTGGNNIDLGIMDCGGPVADCIPVEMYGLQGWTSLGGYGRQLGTYVPSPYSWWPHFTLHQSSGANNSAGNLEFRKQHTLRAALRADSGDGINLCTTESGNAFIAEIGQRIFGGAGNTIVNVVVSGGTATAQLTFVHGASTGQKIRVTGSGVLAGEFVLTGVTSSTVSWTTGAANGTYTDSGMVIESTCTNRWQVTTSGNLMPGANGSYTIGSSSLMPSQSWSQAYHASTTSSQTHLWGAGSSMFHQMLSANSTGASVTAELNFARARGSLSSPSNPSSSDVIGDITASAYRSGSYDLAGRMRFLAGSIGSAWSGEFRLTLATTGGAMTDVLTATSSAITLAATSAASFNGTGSNPFQVGGSALVDSSRNITSGTILPYSSGSFAVGSQAAIYAEIWSRSFRSYTSGTQDHLHAADAAVNNYLTTYNSTNTTSPFYHMRHARGTESSPSVSVNGDRLGGLLWWGYHSGGGFSPSAVIETYINNTVGSSIVPSEMRFRTQDSAGVLADRVYISSAGLAINGNLSLITASTGIAIQSSGTYSHGANIGTSATVTVRNSAGTGTCTLTFSGGLYISTTC